MIRKIVAAQLCVGESKPQVISPNMGGGFGHKGKRYPAETIIAGAARKRGRSVK